MILENIPNQLKLVRVLIFGLEEMQSQIQEKITRLNANLWFIYFTIQEQAGTTKRAHLNEKIANKNQREIISLRIVTE